jgi:hypothetical protein
MDLWSTDECAAWARALDAYPAALEHRAASRLGELDDWYRRELPPLIAARTPPHVTHDELVRATEWKMKRGAWRARNLVLVRGNSAAAVEAASREAFALVPDPRKPVARLAELDGVGPATASALLAAARPDVYPFFDELVAEAIPGLGKVAFTLPYYLRYASALRERAARLQAACPRGKWTVGQVGLALWAAVSLGPTPGP